MFLAVGKFYSSRRFLPAGFSGGAVDNRGCATTTHLRKDGRLTIFQADARCSRCKNWVTVYLTLPKLPSKQTNFRFTCTCHREVDGTGVVFAESRAIPVGAIVAAVIA